MRKIFCLRSVLFALVVLAMSVAMAPTSSAQIAISVGFAPPALPVYEQPICPGDGYLWTPGYWAWDSDFDDYYWVPGTWVLAPEVGFLWTPPWWGWGNGVWLWHAGYWGPHIGFYGGINYGFGYFGYGFVGGRWDHDHFFYNREVTNINVVNIHNVYEERVTNVTVNRVSFNGGPGGIEARPRAEDEIAERDRHVGAVAAQTQHWQAARGNPELRAAANHGKPPIAATGRPGEFNGREVAPAREAGGAYNPPANRGRSGGGAPAGGGGNFGHARDLPAYEKATPNTGNPKQDRKYQQQQDKMAAQQAKEQQKLQQQQEREHQQAERQHSNDVARQQMEQRHQQQAQQMQERHTQQRQQLQQRYSPPPGRRK